MASNHDSPGDSPIGLKKVYHYIKNLFHKNKEEESIRETIEELIETRGDLKTPIKSNEKALVINALAVHDLTVEDVMVPRADIISVSQDISFTDLITFMKENRHSRYPVYKDTLDDCFGLIHIKDVLAQSLTPKKFSVSNITRKLLFISPTMRVLDLLVQMRAARVHMALVVDEHGGIDGLVTIEDLVEEIVGEIHDEHETDTPPEIIKNKDGSLTADARISIEEFDARVGFQTLDKKDEEEIDTLGGLIFMLTDRIPATGEIIKHPSGMEFEILEADPRRIKLVKIYNIPSKTKNDS